MQLRIMVGIACHNRKLTTKKCIDSFYSSEISLLKFEIYLLDDGSTDGTASMIKHEFPHVRILFGDGSYYWAKSMSILHEISLKEKFDGFLMLNDDVELISDFPKRLDEAISTFPGAILVGATKNSREEASYSGLTCSKNGNYFRLKTQIPSTSHIRVDSFVGNFVYIPSTVSQRIGILDGEYSHHYADVEYGIRATKQKIPVLLLPDYVGFCESNEIRTRYLDKYLSLGTRLNLLNSRQCHPIRDHFRFYRSIGGNFWIPNFFRSYLGKLLLTFFPQFVNLKNKSV